MALILRNLHSIRRQVVLASRQRFNSACKQRSKSLAGVKFGKNHIVDPFSKGLAQFSNSSNSFNAIIDAVTFERNCSETLETLCDYFEELVENSPHLKLADISFGDGVLTVKFGEPYGTYVINRQSPNRQIWLSSPVTGPKRYEFVPNKLKIGDGFWLYPHDGVTLHELLQTEIAPIVKAKVNFLELPFGRRL